METTVVNTTAPTVGAEASQPVQQASVPQTPAQSDKSARFINRAEHQASKILAEIEGMKSPLTIHESIDKWTAEGNQEREAPYGLVSKQDMINAILDGDLDTIDSSLIGANVALYAIDQDEDLSKEVKPDIRNYIEFNVSNAPKHQYFSKQDKIQFLKLLG